MLNLCHIILTCFRYFKIWPQSDLINIKDDKSAYIKYFSVKAVYICNIYTKSFFVGNIYNIKHSKIYLV